MQLKELIFKLKLENPDIRGSQIASKLGCTKQVVSYHLNEMVREGYKHRANKNRKINMILLKKASGGKCSKCGYAKCLAALDFHHTSSDDKRGIVCNILRNYGKIAAAEEAKKCILLCRNCHSELHYSEFERWA